MFVFRSDDATVAQAFAANDPYVRAGVATSWRVHPWNVVVGAAS